MLEDMQSSGVKTLEQVSMLRERVRAWLRDHPDDREVIDTNEGLVMLEYSFIQQ